MDGNDIILSQDVASEINDHLHQHLLHWQGMSQNCASRGVLRWKLRPKHHSLEEIGVFVEKTQVNPRFTVCFQDENFLGHLKRIGAKCHETTMLTRAFQRLTLLLSQRWKETRERAKHAERSWNRKNQCHPSRCTVQTSRLGLVELCGCVKILVYHQMGILMWETIPKHWVWCFSIFRHTGLDHRSIGYGW